MELWPLCTDAIVGTAPSLQKCKSSHTSRNGTSWSGTFQCSKCAGLCVFPQKEMRKAVVNTLHPFGAYFEHILYLQKGGRNVPIQSGSVFGTHINKYVEAPGVLLHGAQKGLWCVTSADAQDVFVTPSRVSLLLGDACCSSSANCLRQIRHLTQTLGHGSFIPVQN